MTSALTLLAALAVFGTAPLTIWPPEYIAQRATEAAAEAPSEPTSLPLDQFAVFERRCVRVPGRPTREMCEGHAWRLPSLVAGGAPITFFWHVRVNYVREGDATLSVVLDLRDIHLSRDAEAEIARQLATAAQCTSPWGDLELMSTAIGPAQTIRAPIAGLMVVTPRLVREAVPACL